jgi:hypothetical protein
MAGVSAVVPSALWQFETFFGKKNAKNAMYAWPPKVSVQGLTEFSYTNLYISVYKTHYYFY